MSKSTYSKNSFILGEISPRCFGRFETSKPIYRDGAAILENFLIFQYGGAFFRPGTQYIATAGQTAPVRLETFRYSLGQQYILELGNQYMQFYANNGQVQSGGFPVNIVTPYLQADLFNLQFANQDDVSYIANPNYPLYKLIRTSATSFMIQKVQFIGGPFMDSNVGNVTITPSALSGNVTLTATIPAWSGSGTQYVPGDYVTNSGTEYLCQLTNVSSGSFATDLAAGYWVAQNFFQAGHVGALWSLGTGTPNASPPEPAATIVITGYTNGTTVNGYVQNNPDGTSGVITGCGTAMSITATSIWAEGAFSTFRGWPVSVAFHEGRLVLGGTKSQTKTIFASSDSGYENFSPGQSGNSDAWTFASTIGGAIQWMKSMMVNGSVGLRVGTDQGTTVWLDGTPATGITPSSPPQIVPGPDYQVQYTLPRAISSFLFYMQGNSYQLRQLVFDFTIGADKSEDMTLLSDHILRDGGGVVQIARQQSPNDRIWCVRSDGQLAILTRNVEQQVLGWSRMVAGATSGGNGTFNSIAIYPVAGTDDQIWVSVSRIINGVQQQFIEVFTPELFNNPWEPNRLDASLSINNPITITGISQANPAVVTAPAHGLTNGQRIRIDKVVGMTRQIAVPPSTVATTQSINGFQYLVANVTTNTFTITDEFGNSINTTNYTPYLSGGQARLMNTTFSGLSYLNGETVSVVADSGLPAAQQTFLVSGGQITLPNPAAVVHIGLPYTGTLQFLQLGEDIQGQTSQTKKRKVYKPVLRMWMSIGGQWGDSMKNLFPIVYPPQNPNVIPSSSPVLYTGDVECSMESFFSTSWAPFLIQNQPLPLMLLAAVLRADIEEDK